MAVLPTQSVSRAGLNATYAAVSAGGDKFTPGDDVFLHVKNGNAAACTVTITTPGTFEGQAIADVSVNVPAAGERFIGPLSAALFRNSADGYGDLAWSVSASVTAAVVTV